MGGIIAVTAHEGQIGFISDEIIVFSGRRERIAQNNFRHGRILFILIGIVDKDTVDLELIGNDNGFKRRCLRDGFACALCAAEEDFLISRREDSVFCQAIILFKLLDVLFHVFSVLGLRRLFFEIAKLIKSHTSIEHFLTVAAGLKRFISQCRRSAGGEHSCG